MNLKVCNQADFYKLKIPYKLKRNEGNGKKMDVKPSISNVIQAVTESWRKIAALLKT